MLASVSVLLKPGLASDLGARTRIGTCDSRSVLREVAGVYRGFVAREG